MCGILGVFNAEDTVSLETIVAHLKHRGPDEQFHSQKTTKYGYVSFGATRLAIVNTQRSFKPNTDANIIVLLNGEIWNYKSLAHQLTLNSETVSEQEVILTAYQKWGPKFAEHLDGMYAIAIIDLDKKKFVLVRDPVGIKPLFYMTFQQGFAFASDMKSLVQMKMKRFTNLNYPYFLNQYVFRYSDSHDTILPGIHEVPAATIITYSFKSKRTQTRAFNVTQLVADLPLIQCAKTFEAGLAQSLLKRCAHTDSKQIGLLLSGGVDSSLIAMMLRQLGVEGIVCFFVGSKKNPDYKWAKKIAEISHYPLYHLNFDIKEIMHSLPNICYHRPDALPGAHIYFAFKKIRQLFPEMKVVLCGEGADEVLAGYPVFTRASLYMEGIKKRLALSRSTTALAQKFLSLKDTTHTLPEAFSAVLSLANQDELIQNHLNPLDHFSMAQGIELRVPYLDLNLVHRISKDELMSQVINRNQKAWIKELLKKYAPTLGAAFYTRSKIAFPNVMTGFDAQMLTKLRPTLKQTLIFNDYWMLKPLSKFMVENCYTIYCRRQANSQLEDNAHHLPPLRNLSIHVSHEATHIRSSIQAAFPMSGDLRRDGFLLTLETFVSACNHIARKALSPPHLLRQFVLYAHRDKSGLDDFGKALLRYEYRMTCITEFPGFHLNRTYRSTKISHASNTLKPDSGIRIKKFKYDFVSLANQYHKVTSVHIPSYKTETWIAFHPEALDFSNKILKISEAAAHLCRVYCPSKNTSQIRQAMRHVLPEGTMVTHDALMSFVDVLKKKELIY